MHAELAAAEYVPAGQLLQLDRADAWVAVDAVPALHASHSLLPVPGWYRPATQSAQDWAAVAE